MVRETEKETGNNGLFSNILQSKVSGTIRRRCKDRVLTGICHLSLKDGRSEISGLSPLISLIAGASPGLSQEHGLQALCRRGKHSSSLAA